MYSLGAMPAHRPLAEKVVKPLEVLVVDDDFDITDMLKNNLEPALFKVVAITSGLQGIELVRTAPPDILMVDLSMPDIDGLQFCREIRKFSKVPILMLSAVDKTEIVAQALDVGADDYLVKPTKDSVLIAHLNKLARRARAEQH
jgi:two-component system, OmpR family, response regulator MprA